MGSDPAITVEVSISEELRRLLAIMRGLPAPIDPRPALPTPPSTEEDVRSASGAWPEVRLRRDGERPIIFRGLPVLTRRCQTYHLPGTAEQRLTIYLAEGDLLYASLVFEPPETASARPSHRCQQFTDRNAFELFLRAWHPELCLETVFAMNAHHQQNLAASQVAVRSSFNAMAADCLRKGILHS